MKNLNDEILNKLIDNELSTSEINQINELLSIDSDAMRKVKAHKMVDAILRKLEVEPAPINFTELIMKKISKSTSVKYQKYGFFRFIVATFGILTLSMMGYMISLAIQTNPEAGTQSRYESIIDYMKNTFLGIDFSVSLNSNLLMVVGASLTLILLLTAYFIFEHHKAFKQKLDQYI